MTVSGCIGDGRPDACDSAEVTLNLTLTATELDPANVDVCRDQEVTLRIQAEADGIIHIHGYDEEVPATEVAATETPATEAPATATAPVTPAATPAASGGGVTP